MQNVNIKTIKPTAEQLINIAAARHDAMIAQYEARRRYFETTMVDALRANLSFLKPRPKTLPPSVRPLGRMADAFRRAGVNV
jgi:hypothetical protein